MHESTKGRTDMKAFEPIEDVHLEYDNALGNTLFWMIHHVQRIITIRVRIWRENDVPMNVTESSNTE